MIIIREAISTDKEQLEALIEKWTATQKINAPQKIHLIENAGWSSESPLYYCAVAEDPSTMKLVGYALCTYNYAIWVGKSLLLENIFVEDASRRQSVGSRLLSAIFQHGLAKGCKQVNYYTQKDDLTAVKFFEKFRGTNLTEKEGWQVYSTPQQAIESNSR